MCLCCSTVCLDYFSDFCSIPIPNHAFEGGNVIGVEVKRDFGERVSLKWRHNPSDLAMRLMCLAVKPYLAAITFSGIRRR